MTKSTSTSRETIERRIEDLAMRDARGRAIGVSLSLGTEVFEALPADAMSWSCIEPGFYWWARAQVTRNGREYGASQSAQFFATRDEAEAYLARRVETTRKGAAKKVALSTTGEG